MSDNYYENELAVEREAKRVIVDQLLHQITMQVHEHRDNMEELEHHYKEEQEKLTDHIEDLYRYIKKLEEKVVEADGVVETTDCPHLDISDMKPERVVAYK